jgi:phasin family protein
MLQRTKKRLKSVPGAPICCTAASKERFVTDQVQREVTESKAAVLPQTEAAKAAAPVPAKEVAPAAKAIAPQARRQPAPRAAARTAKRAKPANKPAARKAKPASPAPKTARAVKKAARPIKAGVKKMANTNTKATEQFTAVIGDVNARAKTAFEKSSKIVEQLADLTRGNVEAIVASSKVAAKGVEILGQDAADYGRKSFEDASAALKSFAEVKSATDFFKLQGDFARSAFDAAVAESARVSETVMKLANDVAEPINSRYAVAAERVKTLAA